MKLPLSDELSDATTGAATVESSYAHYLELARDAAARADDLGDQLIAQGMEMDMRAEAARDELEDLCGGTVNIPRIQEYACEVAHCDIAELFESASTPPEDLASDLSGLRNCLGLNPETQPVDAALGDVPLCMWQFDAGTGAAALPPCTCPGETLSDGTQEVRNGGFGGSKELWRSLCGTNRKKCPEVLGTTPSCQQVFGPALATFDGDGKVNDFVGFRSKQTDEVLNISVSAANSNSTSTVDKDGDNVFACRDTLALRTALQAMGNGTLNGSVRAELQDLTRSVKKWATQKNLKAVADLVGFGVNNYSMPKLTSGGRDWVTLTQANGAPAIDTNWPCLPHQLIRNTTVGYDRQAAEACSGPESESIRHSMFCGGMCPAGSAFERAQTLAGDVRYRLGSAVVALKAISGGSFNNFAELANAWDTSAEVLGANAELPDNAYIAGTLPSWVPYPDAAGQTYARASGGQMCWFRFGKAYCNRVTPFDTLYGDHGSVFSSNPSFLYLPKSMCRKSGTCGGMSALLDMSSDARIGVSLTSPNSSCPVPPPEFFETGVHEVTNCSVSTQVRDKAVTCKTITVNVAQPSAEPDPADPFPKATAKVVADVMSNVARLRLAQKCPDGMERHPPSNGRRLSYGESVGQRASRIR